MMKTENYKNVEELEKAWKQTATAGGEMPIWHDYLDAECSSDFLMYVLEMDIEQRA